MILTAMYFIFLRNRSGNRPNERRAAAARFLAAAVCFVQGGRFENGKQNVKKVKRAARVIAQVNRVCYNSTI